MQLACGFDPDAGGAAAKRLGSRGRSENEPAGVAIALLWRFCSVSFVILLLGS